MSTLYIVSTPIGNLEDITLRALRVLKEADIILSEDTRVTKKLLNHYNIKGNLVRYDEHKHKATEDMILESLQEGANIALVTDAGTPTISDPGHRLISRVIEIHREIPTINVASVPGASSLTAALSLSGISADKFNFFGFIPHKKGKETMLIAIVEEEKTAVFFESTHRIVKTLESLKDKIDWERKISVIKEITKIHEEVISGNIREVISYFEENKDKVRGEFVVVVEGRK